MRILSALAVPGTAQHGRQLVARDVVSRTHSAGTSVNPRRGREDRTAEPLFNHAVVLDEEKRENAKHENREQGECGECETH